MSIVTKKGDFGKTTLASGATISKGDRLVDAYGTVDELVSFLGLARSHLQEPTMVSHVKKMQCHLFMLATELAGGTKFAEPCSCYEDCKRTYRDRGLCDEHLKEIEGVISEYEPHLKLTGFIVPGDTKESAFLDVARTICRRVERKLVNLHEEGLFNNGDAIKYINRLSDLIYIFARHA